MKIFYVVSLMAALLGGAVQASVSDPKLLEYSVTNDPQKWAQAWIGHMSCRTKQEYREALTQDSTPEIMVKGWITEGNYAFENTGATYDPVAKVTKSEAFADAVVLKPAEDMNAAGSQSLKSVSIEKLRELVLVQYMSIMGTLQKYGTSIGVPTEHGGNGALQILYALTELSLQRWAENELSEEQWALLFKQQHGAISQLVGAMAAVTQK